MSKEINAGIRRVKAIRKKYTIEKGQPTATKKKEGTTEKRKYKNRDTYTVCLADEMVAQDIFLGSTDADEKQLKSRLPSEDLNTALAWEYLRRNVEYYSLYKNIQELQTKWLAIENYKTGEQRNNEEFIQENIKTLKKYYSALRKCGKFGIDLLSSDKLVLPDPISTTYDKVSFIPKGKNISYPRIIVKQKCVAQQFAANFILTPYLLMDEIKFNPIYTTKEKVAYLNCFKAKPITEAELEADDEMMVEKAVKLVKNAALKRINAQKAAIKKIGAHEEPAKISEPKAKSKSKNDLNRWIIAEPTIQIEFSLLISIDEQIKELKSILSENALGDKAYSLANGLTFTGSLYSEPSKAKQPKLVTHLPLIKVFDSIMRHEWEDNSDISLLIKNFTKSTGLTDSSFYVYLNKALEYSHRRKYLELIGLEGLLKANAPDPQ